MTARIEIDGTEHAVEAGRDLLSVCLGLGHEVPFFCWHPALGSVGACRLCAVRVGKGEDDGEIAMACMTGAEDGQRIRIADPEAEAFRARVIEWLMIGHPHDCPSCTEAGSCHLQDMTVLTGHDRRRHRFAKRTHRNQWLGPLVGHEMNRCIACYRCTRFYRGHAGGRDLDVFGSARGVWFGRAGPGALENPFAGNLAEVCPTGVFSDRRWASDYARKWDMFTAPSLCGECSVGCAIFASARNGRVRRIQNRHHPEVNGHFLCDRGRFGAASTPTGDARLVPAVAGEPVPAGRALEAAREACGQGAIGIGSPRASLEANAALRRLVGPERFFAGIPNHEASLASDMLAALRRAPGGPASLADLEAADAVLVLGEDLTGTAPRAALALRQMTRGAEFALARAKGVPDWQDSAVRVAGEGRLSPLHLVSPVPDALDDIATTHRCDPEDAADLGFAVAERLAGGGDGPGAEIAADLAKAERPVVVSGAGCGSARLVAAAEAVAHALGDRARLALFPSEANTVGLAMLCAPELRGLEDARDTLAAGRTAVVLGTDPEARGGQDVLAACARLIVLDDRATATVARADVALPVAGPGESAGTWINHEGRAQRAEAASPPSAPEARALLDQLGGTKPREGPDAVLADLVRGRPDLDALSALRTPGGPAIARAPAVQPGRTADDRAGRLAEAAPPDDPTGPMRFSMEGRQPVSLPAGGGAGYLATGWHSANAIERLDGPEEPETAARVHGVRLIAPAENRTPPSPPAPSDGEGLLLVPLHDPFAGAEAFRNGPLLAERAAPARVAMHPEDADEAGLAAGQTIRIDGTPAPAPLSLDPGLARGIVAVSARALSGASACRRVRVEGAA